MEELWLFLCAYTLVEIFSALCFRFCYPAVMFFIGWVKRNLFCLQAFFFGRYCDVQSTRTVLDVWHYFSSKVALEEDMNCFLRWFSKIQYTLIYPLYMYVDIYLFYAFIYIFIYSPADLLGSLWEVFRSQIMSNVQERAVPKADNPWRSTRVQS